MIISDYVTLTPLRVFKFESKIVMISRSVESGQKSSYMSGFLFYIQTAYTDIVWSKLDLVLV